MKHYLNMSAAIKCVLLASCACPSVAFAQAVEPAATGPAADDADDNAIIVTAQRREEKLVDVPISVTVVSGAQLGESGAVTTRDLSTTVPGLLITSVGSNVQPTIRGVGSSLSNVGSEAAVALYIDGVYSPSQGANMFALANVAQIEVLKGPQGTLFGRNATGGAILVTTRKPSYDPELKINLGYGSFGEMQASAYLTGPIADGIAADITVHHRSDDGFARDALTGAKLAIYKETGMRSKVLLEPTDSLTVTLAGDYTETSDNSAQVVKVLNGNTSAVGAIIPPERNRFALSLVPINDFKSFGGSITAELDLGGAKLKSLTAQRGVVQHALTDNDRTQLRTGSSELHIRQDTFSQEVTLASDGSGPLSWIVGGYYFRDIAKTPEFLLNGAPFITSEIDTYSVAGFSELTYQLTDRLSILGGIRYSYEHKDFDAFRTTGRVADESKGWGAWTPRASIRYKPTDETSVYFTYSEGFKSGAYLATVIPAASVNPEYIKSYEAGFKFARGQNYFNVSGYYYDYTDLQVSIYQPGAAILRNAASARIYGIEAEGMAKFSDSFNLRAGFAYNNAKYRSFPDAVVLTPRPTGGNTQLNGDATGNYLVRSPKFTANATANVIVPVGDEGKLTFSGSGSYNSGFFWNVSNRLKQPEYIIVNGSISWKSESFPMSVSLWGRNLTDKTYAVFVTDTTAADAISYGRPRTFGISLGFEF